MNFFQILVVASPGPYPRTLFEIFETFFFFFTNIFRFLSDGTLWQKQIAAECFQTSPELSSNWSLQTTFGIFKILKIEISTHFFVRFR